VRAGLTHGNATPRVSGAIESPWRSLIVVGLRGLGAHRLHISDRNGAVTVPAPMARIPGHSVRRSRGRGTPPAHGRHGDPGILDHVHSGPGLAGFLLGVEVGSFFAGVVCGDRGDQGGGGGLRLGLRGSDGRFDDRPGGVVRLLVPTLQAGIVAGQPRCSTGRANRRGSRGTRGRRCGLHALPAGTQHRDQASVGSSSRTVSFDDSSTCRISPFP
jgi:hypothetical protein